MENRGTKETFVNIFQEAQVAIGMPVFCFWEHLLDANPDAKVILTVRKENEWWDSVQRAKALMDRDLPGAPLRHGALMQALERFLSPSYHQFCNVLRFAWNTALGSLCMEELNEATVRNNYRKHNAYVAATLQGRKTSRGEPQFLIYDVRDGWGPLCAFLGKEVPAEDFPTVMHVPYFPVRQPEDGGLSPGSTGSPDGDLDVGHEFEEILVPDSDFGIRMRRELRQGLTMGLGTLALIVAPMVVSLYRTALTGISPLVLSFFFLAFVAVGWQAYVVMHSVVMRVPALVVLPMMMKSLLIALCLQISFITYGILKEMIVVQDNVASTLVVFSTRVMSVCCATCALYLTEGRVNFGGVPLTSFLYFGLTNELSTLAGYKMLRYLSFPVQVMAKSCTLLPNMIMGRAINGTRYSCWQYAQALGAMACVVIMHLSGEHKQKQEEGSAKGWSHNVMAVALLVLLFVCDSFTSQYQTALYKKHPSLSQTQMMLAGNSMGLLISSVFVATSWPSVSNSLAYLAANPPAIGRMLALGLSGAMGQFCIYTAIKVLGPLPFAWMMTVRQLLSVLISLVAFGHGISAVKLLCIGTVFAIMSSKHLSRAYHHMRSRGVWSLSRGRKEPTEGTGPLGPQNGAPGQLAVGKEKLQ
jgi:adenosine 3'-phospho 5'-phosphosulfate transporter B2